MCIKIQSDYRQKVTIYARLSSVAFKLHPQIFRLSELGRRIVKCETDNCPEGTHPITLIDLVHKSSLLTTSHLHNYEFFGTEMAQHVSHQRTLTAITCKLPAIKNDYDVLFERNTCAPTLDNIFLFYHFLFPRKSKVHFFQL